MSCLLRRFQRNAMFFSNLQYCVRGMTNYHIGAHRTTWDNIGPHRTNQGSNTSTTDERLSFVLYSAVITAPDTQHLRLKQSGFRREENSRDAVKGNFKRRVHIAPATHKRLFCMISVMTKSLRSAGSVSNSVRELQRAALNDCVITEVLGSPGMH